MGRIIPKKQGKNIYYYYHETYRKKVNQADLGKVRGSGKSKVHTRRIYLGTAEQILKLVQGKRISIQTLH